MSPRGGRGLRKTSSLVISSPTKSSVPGRRPGKINVETVPDSEEEREKKTATSKGEIVELSSESDGNRKKESITGNKSSFVVSDPFLSSLGKPAATLSKFNAEVVEDSETEDDSDVQPRYFPKASKVWRTIVSDSEDEPRENQDRADYTEPIEDAEDGAVLVLNDPPSSRKPAARNTKPPTKQRQKTTPSDISSIPNVGLVETGDPFLVKTPIQPQSNTAPGMQTKLPDFFLRKRQPEKAAVTAEETSPGKEASSTATIATPATTKSKPKRKTKKVLQQEKQAHLAAYAQALFDELNTSVFMNRLPKDTPLIWNNRLLATAGRAKWHRDSKGVVTTCIELATKVLDCEERIRNTLSHEMCHLACWVINCNPNENHGGVWRGWVEEVMTKRPDIFITKKHSYDISYKYEWQCQTPTCKKIYGRFSKSIDTAESICGACKEGELVPLFQVRTRKAKVISKLATSKPRDSPIMGSPRPPGALLFTPTRLKTNIDDTVILITSSSDSNGGSASGAETEIGSIAEVSKPKRSTLAAKRPQVDASKVKDDLNKLVTHMSYIDLTND